MAAWDLLRPLLDAATQAEAVTKILLLLFTAAFVLIAANAYFKKSSKRMLLVAASFGIFAIQALLGVIDLFFSPGAFFNPAAMAFTQLLALVLLFIAIFKGG